MEISPEEFIKLTTEGYPLTLRHPEEKFYELFVTFVNESKENNFFAEPSEVGVLMHAGMRTEICQVVYDHDRVRILTTIDDTGLSSTGEYEADAQIKILGYACLGVLFFCDLYALGTGQSARFADTKQRWAGKDTNNKKDTKYDIWPM